MDQTLSQLCPRDSLQPIVTRDSGHTRDTRDMNLTRLLHLDPVSAGGLFAAVDFSLSILGTVLNVVVVVTIK